MSKNERSNVTDASLAVSKTLFDMLGRLTKGAQVSLDLDEGETAVLPLSAVAILLAVITQLAAKEGQEDTMLEHNIQLVRDVFQTLRALTIEAATA